MSNNEFNFEIAEFNYYKFKAFEVNIGEFEQYLKKMAAFFTEREPGSILELTREQGEENSFAWKGFIRERLMKMMGTETDGNVSHPAGKRMKITYATDYQELKVGWIMEKNGAQVYQVEFETKE